MSQGYRVRAGRLSRQVVFQKRTQTANAINELTETWARYHKARAEIITQPGSERYSEQSERTRENIIIRLRYGAKSSALNKGDYRVLYPSTTAEPWDIESVVDVDGRRRVIEVKAVQRE